ncbi:hypothetical protein F511_17127, partial [Dorcoceras hygrometricum]
TTDPLVAESWIKSMEVIFEYLQMPDLDRPRCAIYMLRDEAIIWWEGAKLSVDLLNLIWAKFKQVFFEQYFTTDKRYELKREFLTLKQGSLTVQEYVRMFVKKGGYLYLFFEQYFTTDKRYELKREFLTLKQGSLTVQEYVRMFERGCYFVPLIGNDPEEKLSHFVEGLKPMFKMNVRLSVPNTYREAVDRALQNERDWKYVDEERQQKRQALQQKD